MYSNARCVYHAVTVLRSKTTMCRATLKHTFRQMNKNEHNFIISMDWHCVVLRGCKKNRMKTININHFHWCHPYAMHAFQSSFFSICFCLQTTTHLRVFLFFLSSSSLLYFDYSHSFVLHFYSFTRNAAWLAFDYAAVILCAICLLHFFVFLIQFRSPCRVDSKLR